MSFAPWKLCQCCRSFLATTYGPGGFSEMALCNRCFLKLKGVMVALSEPQKTFEETKALTLEEYAKKKEIQDLEAMAKLDGSWVQEGAMLYERSRPRP